MLNSSEKCTQLTCIVCPNSCRMEVVQDAGSGAILSVTGHLCNRGKVWAEQELLDPHRTLCTSVTVFGGTEPLTSVRTTALVPRSRIPELMELLKGISLPAPVRIGQVVIQGPLGLDCDVIVTRDVKQSR